MKSFFKSVFASCLGSLLALVLIVLIFIGFASVGGDEKQSLKDGVLELKFDQNIPEKTDNIATSYTAFELKKPKTLGLRNILRLIGHAKTDDNIKGISLNIKSTFGGLSTMASINEALSDFKESGKFIYAYSDDYHQMGYYISSIADSVMINPNGTVDLRGFAMMYPFFKKGLDMVGIEYQVFYAGDFKSATEPYRRSDMSPENKFQTRLYLEDVIVPFKEVVGANRGFDDSTLDEIFNNYYGRSAQTALDHDLVDKVVYWDEYISMLQSKLSIEKDINFISLDTYSQSVQLKSSGSYKNKVAVVYAEGNVTYDSENKGEISDVNYIKLLRKIREDDNIKAVVLRVNSPGGSAFTADVVLREIDLIKAAGKPVVASFGDYAASAGYYIAATADTIVAERNSLTGSIGVYSMIPLAAKLAEKIGVSFDTVKTHEHAVGLSNVLEMTEKQKTILKQTTEEVYDQFLSVVARGRGMSKDEVNEVAQGKIWSGERAKEKGLVDVIGSLDEAIEIATSMTDIEGEAKIVEYPKIEMTTLDNILNIFNQSSAEAIVYEAVEKMSDDQIDLKEIKEIFESRSPHAKMPYKLSID